MPDYQYQTQRVTIWMKFRMFMEEIWPFIYKIVNSFFYGTINFIKFLFGGFKPF